MRDRLLNRRGGHWSGQYRPPRKNVHSFLPHDSRRAPAPPDLDSTSVRGFAPPMLPSSGPSRPGSSRLSPSNALAPLVRGASDWIDLQWSLTIASLASVAPLARGK